MLLLSASAAAYRASPLTRMPGTIGSPFARAGARSLSARMGLASPGDFALVRYSLVDAETKAPLEGPEAVFDQGEVRLVVGGGGFIPGLHARVPELAAVGAPQTFSLTPEECFGAANPDLGPARIPLESCPPGLEAGMKVRLATGAKAAVTAVDDEAVTIDANHPLAGKAFEMTAELLAAPRPASEALVEATFAGGCFWGLELAFQREPGVVDTAVGYTQGDADEPTYQQVCAGSTGHTEAVLVTYDPAAVPYGRLCELFWERLGDNRFLLNQVGNDRGTQYRHGIYTHTDEQAAAAAASLAGVEEASGAGQAVHTEVLPAQKFWRAEEYHQQYLQKGGQDAKKLAAETIRCYG